MADLSRVSIADLTAGDPYRTLPLLDEDGRVSEPLVVVDLDDGQNPGSGDLPVGLPGDVPPGPAVAGAGDRLLVGVATRALSPAAERLVSALDLTLVAAGPGAALGRACVGCPDPEAELRGLAAAVAACPQAGLALGQVLRASETLSVCAALDVESFAYSTLLGGPEFARWLEARGARPLPPGAEAPVLTRRDGDRLHITLNRPERRNAYGRELRDALTGALRLASLDPSIERVVLDGAGPAFCSGGDLDEFGTTPDLATAHFVRTRAGAGRLMDELGERLEVRVHGTCVGAGIELPAFAATVVADPGTTFVLPEVRMGLIPGAGGTVSIPRRIGRWRTLYLALSGRPLPTRTALAWGLVDAVTQGPPSSP